MVCEKERRPLLNFKVDLNRVLSLKLNGLEVNVSDAREKTLLVLKY